MYSPTPSLPHCCCLPISVRLGLPTAHPTAQRGLPTAQRGLPTAQRGVPTAQRGVPTAQRGVAAGQSPGKSNRRSPQDYHSNGPSSSGSSPASQNGRSRRLIRSDYMSTVHHHNTFKGKAFHNSAGIFKYLLASEASLPNRFNAGISLYIIIY